MSDLKKYITKRKKTDKEFAEGFEEGYEQFKIGVVFPLRSAEPFGFAGLYETWMSPENRSVKTCTIITTDANDLLKPIHDRMPVIVPKDKEAFWMDPGMPDPRELAAILKPYPAGEMKMAEGFEPAL